MVNRAFKNFVNYLNSKEKKIRDTEKKRVRIKKTISQNRNKLNILNRELKSLITNKKELSNNNYIRRKKTLEMRVESMKKAIEHGEKSLKYFKELIQALKKELDMVNNMTQNYLNRHGINR